jgi:hypothetical protein
VTKDAINGDITVHHEFANRSSSFIALMSRVANAAAERSITWRSPAGPNI